ncbi:hypothetical protein CDAR_309731 [Caerostris darwini]|uniref:Galectin n=1 Tax=Caerostris darwini TaxID=1538125 RepID=A0AAV4VXQ4_9ARAC|nr:hypothetical protein CDAR_309731 [Caerostris darwini]
MTFWPKDLSPFSVTGTECFRFEFDVSSLFSEIGSDIHQSRLYVRGRIQNNTPNILFSIELSTCKRKFLNIVSHFAIDIPISVGEYHFLEKLQHSNCSIVVSHIDMGDTIPFSTTSSNSSKQ